MNMIKKDEVKSLCLLAFLAGELSGKAKIKTQYLMSDVGRGLFAEFKGRDANSVLSNNQECDPDDINRLSSDAMKLMNDIWLKLGDSLLFN